MRTVLKIAILLSVMFNGMSDLTAQLEGHQLFKITVGTQDVLVQGGTKNLMFLLSNYGVHTLSNGNYDADSAYVADLTGDGVVDAADLLKLLESFTTVLWEVGECTENVYECFASNFPLETVAVYYHNGHPVRHAQVSSYPIYYWFIE